MIQSSWAYTVIGCLFIASDALLHMQIELGTRQGVAQSASTDADDLSSPTMVHGVSRPSPPRPHPAQRWVAPSRASAAAATEPAATAAEQSDARTSMQGGTQDKQKPAARAVQRKVTGSMLMGEEVPIDHSPRATHRQHHDSMNSTKADVAVTSDALSANGAEHPALVPAALPHVVTAPPSMQESQGRPVGPWPQQKGDPALAEDAQASDLYRVGGPLDMMYSAVLSNDAARIDGALALDGADIDIRGYEGQTPLFFAVMKGKVKAVQHLLRRGADTSVLQDQDFGVLDAAAFTGRATSACT